MIRFAGIKLSLILIAACLIFCRCALPKPKETVPVTAEQETVKEKPVVIEVEPSYYVEKSVDGVEFIPLSASDLSVPNDAGIVSERDMDAVGDRDAHLRILFRSAYARALMRDMPLLGVLGIDRVHLWPENSRLTWVQNWRGTVSHFNSWGVAGLVLAVMNITADKVFTVSGEILDVYGKTSSYGGSNGVVGYGQPLTDDFFLKLTDYTMPVHAQRFEKGLIYVDGMGKSVFIAGKVPASLMENDKIVGFYDTSDIKLKEKLKFTFEKALETLVNQYERDIKADGPIDFLDFDGKIWVIEMGYHTFSLSGIYVQSCDGGLFIVMLPAPAMGEAEAAALEFSIFEEARTIASPFSGIISESIRIPSASGLAPYPLKNYAEIPEHLKSFALYGIPLTDSFVSIDKTMLCQRFSNGVFQSSILY
ncbi:MAG: hypothetical protein LBB22_00655 [Treponema sp.]|jgi:hypothetical protein|nr:hypothetical protein [Treponema sp.]